MKSEQKSLTVIALIATLGGLLFGLDTGVVNGALVFIAAPDQLNLTPVLEGMVTSSLLVGAAIGSGVGGRLSDTFGRKKCIMGLAVWFFFSTLGCALSISAYQLILFRLLLGLAVGGASVTVLTYLAELSPKNQRGRLVTRNELMIVTGQFLAFVLNAIFAIFMGNTGHVWRYMLGINCIPAILLFFGMINMPESPRWLVVRGKISNALDVLQRVRSSKEVAIAELEEIRDNIEKEQSIEKTTFYKQLLTPWVRRIFFIGIGIGTVQQITGINSINYYGTTILQNAGFTTQAAIIANTANGVLGVTGTLVGMYCIGIFSRRKIFLTGLVVDSIIQILIGIFSLLLIGSPSYPWVMMGLIVIFMFFFQGCIGPLTWLVISEIFPTRFRGGAMGIAVFWSWIMNASVGFTFPILFSTIGLGMTFFGFAFCGLVSIIFVYKCVPETKGYSLEQIEQRFRSC